jgi:hypothetical protein
METDDIGHPALIGISITAAAFEAIAANLPLGSVGVEAQLDAQRQRLMPTPVLVEQTGAKSIKCARSPG